LPTPLRLSLARTDLLDISYAQAGPVDGWPVVLLHGFPYDIHAYSDVVPVSPLRGRMSSSRICGASGRPGSDRRRPFAAVSRRLWVLT
jgi:pimeloyl-ACP methyl ester carboxylesterase